MERLLHDKKILLVSPDIRVGTDCMIFCFVLRHIAFGWLMIGQCTELRWWTGWYSALYYEGLEVDSDHKFSSFFVNFLQCALLVLYLYRARNKVTQLSIPTHAQLQCY